MSIMTNKIPGLTEALKEEYIKDGGYRCPFCRSEDLEWGPKEFVEDVSQAVHCNFCGKGWQDIYGIVDIYIEEEPSDQAVFSDEV